MNLNLLKDLLVQAEMNRSNSCQNDYWQGACDWLTKALDTYTGPFQEASVDGCLISAYSDGTISIHDGDETVILKAHALRSALDGVFRKGKGAWGEEWGK